MKLKKDLSGLILKKISLNRILWIGFKRPKERENSIITQESHWGHGDGTVVGMFTHSWDVPGLIPENSLYKSA